MNTKLMILVASVLGAMAGVFFIDLARPAMDFSYWLGAFAILGVGAGNFAMLVLYKIYRWLEESD